MRETQESQLVAVLELARRAAVRQGAPLEDASDIAQEVAVAYLASEARPAKNWQAWVTTVAQRRAIDLDRARRRRGDHIDQEDLGDAEAYRGQHFQAVTSLQATRKVMLEQLLSGLSERDKQILVLYASGASNEQIAEQVGLKNANSAGVTLNRIKKRLREKHPELIGDLEHPRVY